ncbi:probable serine incorporator isoform X1 [Dioscorea cayenensis subsp. rotundata]|uniref:Probable serine incorporator isoform X1 n=2 Tax=Dioscorea cayennensis subsp. rotundata TaxID=55577 RepID=A0AB40CIS0_DIOCR|nr:probable serine incorporator isoform X1 [Dioscorea cayenensis subsp. rotundata]
MISDFGLIFNTFNRIFLVLQLVSVIEFITWCNDNWMPDSQTKQCDLIGLFFATISCLASYFGIVAMYFMYAPEKACMFNIFFITWTAILVNVLMIVSLHSKVNRGLLSSAIMSSYIVFLCWSTIQSEPSNDKCKTRKWISDNDNWTTILGFLIAIFAIVMATLSTGTDSKFFQFREVEVESDDEIPYQYEVFHFILSIGAMHFAMLFISWELDHTTKRWSIDVGWISTWVKFINETFAASLFLWKLISPVVLNKDIQTEEPSLPYSYLHFDGIMF